MEQGKQQVFQERYRDAIHRAERKGGQQLRQVGNVQLDKGRNQGRDRKFDEHQQKGHSGQHGGHSDLMGATPPSRTGGGDCVDIGFRHKKTLLFLLENTPDTLTSPR